MYVCVHIQHVNMHSLHRDKMTSIFADMQNIYDHTCIIDVYAKIVLLLPEITYYIHTFTMLFSEEVSELSVIK